MEYKYRLVKFLNKKKTKEIDIVPATWLQYVKTSDTLLCKFMPAPYNKERTAKLIHMLKKCELPKEEWPSYPIDLVGRAYSYEEAERKVIHLESKPYAYSTDNEYRAKCKAIEDKKNFKFKSISKTSVPDELNTIYVDLNASIDNELANYIVDDNSSSYSSNDYINKNTKKTHARCKAPEKKEQPKKKQKISDDDSESSDTAIRVMEPKVSNIYNNSRTLEMEDMETPRKFSSQETVHFSKDDINHEGNICNIAGKYYRSLSKQIAYLQSDIVKLSLLIKELQQSFEVLKSKGNYTEMFFNDENDNKEIGVSLPCQNYEEFQKFDEKLSTDDMFRQKIMLTILTSINKRGTVTRNVGQILRTYLSQDLAMAFTTVKSMHGKHVLRNTNLYSCIQDVMRKIFNEKDGTALTPRAFQESVQAVLNNVKDWNGQGHIRKQKSQK